MSKFVDGLLATVLPDQYAYRVIPGEIYNSSCLTASISAYDRRWGDEGKSDTSVDGPVFILSAGWGSGSTLLQRLAMSSGEVVVWGEPLDHAAPIQRMAEALFPIRDGWPPAAHFPENFNLQLQSKAWVANMLPAMESFKDAHRLFLESWLSRSAKNFGAGRWGLKEVRLTIHHALYLKWLFPNAKFLFIYRDVFDSYLSCKGVNWYSVWPQYKVRYVTGFAHHWRFLLEGFISGFESVGGRLVKYESLVAGDIDIDELAEYLGVRGVDKALFEKKVGSRKSKKQKLSLAEKIIIERICGQLRRQLGYAVKSEK